MAISLAWRVAHSYSCRVTHSTTSTRATTSIKAQAAEQRDARTVALAGLGAVLRQHQPLDEALVSDGLAPRDRAFSRLLLLTMLRRMGQIDALIAPCLSKPLAPTAAPVRDILRLGVAQLVCLGIAPHAAVSTAVEMTKSAGFGGFSALANAVLRRLADEGPALAAKQDAGKLNTPAWLWDSWRAAYGEADCRAIAAAHLVEPPLDVTVKDDTAAWAGRLGAKILPTGSLRLTNDGAIPDRPGFAEGEWWVQDAAAALPARLFGAVEGKRIADLCAAPGGKTAQLAAAGASVVSVDVSAARLRSVTENLARLRLSAECVAADVRQWRWGEPFDCVLLDAPCSATGTLRRHPDVAWLRRQTDIAALTKLQSGLLEVALAMLKPGGILVFATCSLQPEEGPERIAALLANKAPVRRVPIGVEEVGGLAELITGDGDLRTLPFHLAGQGGMDAFFAARLQKL